LGRVLCLWTSVWAGLPLFLENLEKSGISKMIREMSGKIQKVRELVYSGKSTFSGKPGKVRDF